MMRKYLLILSLLISAEGMAQAPNYLYGKDIIITTRDTSSAELTIRNTTRNVLGYFKNIGGGKGQYTLIPQTDIIALPDSLLARYTKIQSDARYKSISYVPDWLDITGKPSNFSTTYALSNDVIDSIQARVNTFSTQIIGGRKFFTDGIYLGTKLDAYFNAADSNAIYWRADSVVMAKYKGTARALAFAVSGGYIPYSDTTTLLSQVVRTFGTQTVGGNKTFSNSTLIQQLYGGTTTNWPTSTSGNTVGRHIINGDYGAGSQNGLIIWNENLDTSSKSFLWLSTKSALGAAYQSGAEFRGGIENTTDGQGFLEMRTTNTIGASIERGYIGGSGAVQWGSRNWPTLSVGKTQGRMSLVSSSTPAYVAWSEATPAANNESAIVLGAKTGQGPTTLGGAKLYGGIYNSFTYAGYWKLTTITSTGGEVTSLIADSLQNVTAANNLTVTNDTRSTTFSQGNWLQKLTSNHIDLDYSSVNKYRFKTDGFFQLLNGGGVEIYGNGSNTVFASPYYSLWNAAGTTAWSTQVGASNTYDIWSFASGVGNKQVTIASTGAITASSNLTVNGIYNVPSTSYFKGNATYGFRFNNEADTENLLVIANSGAITASSSVQATKLIGGSSAPSVALGSNITGSVSVTGNDMAGTVTVTVTGTSSLSTLNPLFTLTYNSAYSSTPHVVWSPASANAAALLQAAGGLYLKNSGTSSFQVATVNSYTTPASQTYTFTYQVIQ